MKLLIVLSSTREGRVADSVLALFQEQLTNHKSLKVTVADFKSTPLPFFNQADIPSNGDYHINDSNALAWSQQVQSADMVLFLTAEYNYSYTAILKNAIDWLCNEWTGKPVAFFGYGWTGGSKAITELRNLMTGYLQAEPLDTEAGLTFEKNIQIDGKPIGDEAAKIIDNYLEAVEHSLETR